MRLRGIIRRLERAATPFRSYYAYDPELGRTRMAGPVRVQVQTIDRCNGGCVMCPYAGGQGPARLMDDELYARILRQLAETCRPRLFSPMLQNEPLLDPGLAERVSAARRVLGPETAIAVVTNGSILTEQRVRSLVEAGVDVIAVSLDASRRETYEAIRPGLDFDRVTANTLALLRYRRRVRVQVRFLIQKLNAGQEEVFRRFWRSRGAVVSVQEATNRASALEDYDGVYARRGSRWRDVAYRLARGAGGRLYPACALPFVALPVLVDGRVLACCHDWGPAEIVGDLSCQSLADVWNGPAMNRVRQLLVERRFERSQACGGCSVPQIGDTCRPEG